MGTNQIIGGGGIICITNLKEEISHIFVTELA